MPAISRRFLLLLATLGACAPTRIEPTSTPNTVALPRAERVVVAPFSGSDADALRQALTGRLRTRGMVVVVGDVAASGDRSLLIQAQMAAVPASGGVIAEVQLLYVLGQAAPQFLESFQVEASASRITSVAERDRLAEAMAGRILRFMESRGWR